MANFNKEILRPYKKKYKAFTNSWFETHVPGKTFADVGGLWGLTAEKVTQAVRNGASEASLIDAWAEDSDTYTPWGDLKARWDKHNVEGNCVVADLETPWFKENAGTYDNVYCCGVLYHVPNIFNVVRNLTSIVNERLYLITQTLPNVIENSQGKIVIPENQALLIPSMTPYQKKVLKKFYDTHKYNVAHINSTLPRANEPYIKENGDFHYGPSWWLPTKGMLIKILELFGLQVEGTCVRSPHATIFSCVRK